MVELMKNWQMAPFHTFAAQIGQQVGFNKKHWHYRSSATGYSVADVECWLRFKVRNWRNTGELFGFKNVDEYSLFLLTWT